MDVVVWGLDIFKFLVVVNFELLNMVDGYVYWMGWIGCQGELGLVVNFGDDYDFCDFKKFLVDIDYQLELMMIDKCQLVFGEDVKNVGKLVEKVIVKVV